MDRSEVKKIVDEHVRFMIWDFQIQRWRLDVSFDEAEEEKEKARCTADPSYFTAYINIDPARHEDKDDVLRSLRHELLHIMDAPYEIYRKTIAQLLTEEAFHALDEVFIMAKEQTRFNIESMIEHGYKLPLGKRDVEYEPVSPYDEVID